MREWEEWLPWVVVVVIAALFVGLIAWAVSNDTPRNEDRGTYVCYEREAQ